MAVCNQYLTHLVILYTAHPLRHGMNIRQCCIEKKEERPQDLEDKRRRQNAEATPPGSTLISLSSTCECFVPLFLIVSVLDALMLPACPPAVSRCGASKKLGRKDLLGAI